MKRPTTGSYQARLKATRAADRRHDLRMTAIAERGGIRLGQLQSMSGKNKAAFIAKHRNV